MFSHTAEYALRAAIYLAMHPEGLCNSQSIAGATKVPPGYISKILKDLADAGLVNSQRGPHGGFSLARQPDQITILQVVNAVHPIQRIGACPLGIKSHRTRLCRLHQKLDEAIASVEQTFGSATIADMIEPAASGTMCLFPRTSRTPRPAPSPAAASDSAGQGRSRPAPR